MNDKDELLIIIPAYNEAEIIERVVNKRIGNNPKKHFLIGNVGSTVPTGKICGKNKYI